MPVTISFRVAEQLEEYLEEEARREMTTKSAIARQLLTAKVREEMDEEAREVGRRAAEAVKNRNNTQIDREPLQSVQEYEFGSKAKADAVRKEFSEYVSEVDDARFTRVKIAEDTPGDVVNELERRSEG